MPASNSSPLASYNAKRAVAATPEPFGPSVSRGGRTFVVQHHAARRTHYDLRLEVDGVLWSWAVPKGPSPNPADKRLAIKVEDHPVDYADFEGVIPQGNYGAGAVIVWDRGVWRPGLDPKKGLAKGKLLLELFGHKLRGTWTLVKTTRGEQEWLLIKERDSWVRESSTEYYTSDSVFSGLTVEQLKAEFDPAKALRRKLGRLGAPARNEVPRGVKIMLAEKAETPFSKKGWCFEIKYDGYRLLAAKRAGVVALSSRNGADLTSLFPEIERAVAALPFDDFIFDGEVVVNDSGGLPSFQLLQQRAKLSRKSDIERARYELPAAYFAFDLLFAELYDTRAMPLRQRLATLESMLPSAGTLKFSSFIKDDGEAMYKAVCDMRLEGVMAKDASSKYIAGRSSKWLKIVADRRDDFAVVGYTRLRNSTQGIGALHLAQHEAGHWSYAGRVGSGFSDAVRAELFTALAASEGAEAPAGANATKADIWVTPTFVCEVKFKGRTQAGRLRHPVFVRLRNDKSPLECERGAAAPTSRRVPKPASVVEDEPERTVSFSNQDKVFWPEQGITKGDLIEYYREIAVWILPYLRDRPVLLTRYPDGIDGKSFFQLDAPDFVPSWVRVERVKNQGVFVVDDVETLLYLVNLGTIPLHIWSSRIGSLDRPDWCILDLDPKDAPFEHVATIARALQRLCEDIELSCFVKSSGSTGLHVVIPLGRQIDHAQSRALADLLAHVCVAELPRIATVTRVVSKRDGRVYIDAGQNGEGKTLVSPFCVRPVPEAAVAMTLNWSQVRRSLNIRKYTLATAPQYLRKRGEDPMIGVLDEKPDLLQAMTRLEARIQDAKRSSS